jgi:hypothetical protein
MANPSGYTNPKAKGNKSAAKPKTPAKIKVSQATIDHIKKIGMTKALKEIEALGKQSRMKPGDKTYATMRQGGKELLAGEFATGVKRMYGERRFGEASNPGAAKKKKTIAGITSQPSRSQSPNQAGPKKASTKYSPAPFKKPKPKSGGSSTSKMK